MSLPGPLVCRRGAVPVEHLARAPTGEAHEVALLTASGEPVMGERVPELVWVKMFNPSHPGPSLNDPVDAEMRQVTLSA